MLVLACVSMSSYAVNPIKEGNMIAGHVIVKGTEESIPFATVMILLRQMKWWFRPTGTR